MKFYARNIISRNAVESITFIVILFVIYKIIKFIIKDYRAEKAAYGTKKAFQKRGVILITTLGIFITIAGVWIYSTVSQIYGYYEIKGYQIKIWYLNPLKSTKYIKIEDIKCFETNMRSGDVISRYIITKNHEKFYISQGLKNDYGQNLYEFFKPFLVARKKDKEDNNNQIFKNNNVKIHNYFTGEGND